MYSSAKQGCDRFGSSFASRQPDARPAVEGEVMPAVGAGELLGVALRVVLGVRVPAGRGVGVSVGAASWGVAVTGGDGGAVSAENTVTASIPFGSATMDCGSPVSTSRPAR